MLPLRNGLGRAETWRDRRDCQHVPVAVVICAVRRCQRSAGMP